ARVAPARVVRCYACIAQPRRVLAIDDPFDLRAVDADVAQRAVVEGAKLAHRRLAFAPERVSAPPFAGGGDGGLGRRAENSAYGCCAQRAHPAGDDIAQRLRAGGVGTTDEVPPAPVPLLRRQAGGN